LGILPHAEENFFHTLSFLSLPVGPMLPGTMEANEVLQCCATKDAMGDTGREKKTGEQGKKA